MRRSWQSPYAMLDGTLSTVADRPRWARPTSNIAAARFAVCVKLRQAHSVFMVSSYDVLISVGMGVITYLRWLDPMIIFQ